MRRRKRVIFVSLLQRYIDEPLRKILDMEVLHTLQKLFVFAALAGFLTTLALVFAKEQGWLASPSIPENYFSAIYIAFSFILFYEVLSMIYALPLSIADSIAKQYRVISLVLIRHVFEMVGELQHMGSILDDWSIYLHLIEVIFGPLLVIFLIGIYSRIQTHASIVRHREDVSLFVFTKRLISLLLILILVYLALRETGRSLQLILNAERSNDHFGLPFYGDVFTVMIFVDILLVLVTMNYGEDYHVVFRNTGLMISTIVMRLGFNTPMASTIILSATAVTVGILTTLIYNYYVKNEMERLNRLRKKGEQQAE